MAFKDKPANSLDTSEGLKSDIKKNALENVLADFEGRSNVIDFLRRWWCRYYKRPYLDPLFLQYTPEQLLLEFYETVFFEDEKARTEAQKTLLNNSGKTPEEEEEEIFKEMMGELYQTKDEMLKSLKEQEK